MFGVVIRNVGVIRKAVLGMEMDTRGVERRGSSNFGNNRL